jgi:dethiobiotin synthetase
MSRPERLVLVAGTGTDVGKTWVTAAALAALRARGLAVAARKPAQSFDPPDADAARTDADLLGAATGEDARTVCPVHRWYPVPLAPPMAADVLGRPPVKLAELVAELAWPAHTAVGAVETAGGVRSPQADDGDVVDLAWAIAPDLVVLVADAGLGTINAVRLSADVLSPWRTLVVLNRYDPAAELHTRNAAWLANRCGYEVATSAGAVAAALHP